MRRKTNQAGLGSKTDFFIWIFFMIFFVPILFRRALPVVKPGVVVDFAQKLMLISIKSLSCTLPPIELPGTFKVEDLDTLIRGLDPPAFVGRRLRFFYDSCALNRKVELKNDSKTLEFYRLPDTGSVLVEINMLVYECPRINKAQYSQLYTMININIEPATNWFQKHRSVTTLILKNTKKCSISESEYQQLALALSRMRSLTHLEFCNYKLNSLDVCRAFATTFSSLVSMQNLNLSNNSIDIHCFKELAPALANMKSMTRLELRNNWIPESACTVLVEMLTSMPLLMHVDLKNNRFGSENHFDLTKNRFGSEVVPALSTLTHLTFLDLSANQIRAFAIAPVFSMLEHLQLRHNSLGSLGICDLVPALSSMCSLRHLDLQNACIEFDGSIELAVALETLPGLTHLNLRKNFIGDDGCIALATAFSSMMSLTHLDLRRNNISARGCEALEPALYSMLALLHLNLSHNPCSNEDHEDSRLLLVVAASTAKLSVTLQFN